MARVIASPGLSPKAGLLAGPRVRLWSLRRRAGSDRESGGRTLPYRGALRREPSRADSVGTGLGKAAVAFILLTTEGIKVGCDVGWLTTS